MSQTARPRPKPESEPLSPVHIFLDESGTHSESALVLTGAVEVLNLDLVEQTMAELTQLTVAQDHLWQADDTKRAAFTRRGFHYTEDNAGVQGELISAFGRLPFRASVTYSRKTLELPVEDLLISMFFTQVLNLLRKYDGQHLIFVFEENPSMNGLYSKIVEHAGTFVPSERRHVETWVGEKPNAGLSLVDYVIGIVGSRLLHYFGIEPKMLPYKVAHYDAIQPRISHILEIDNGRYRSRFSDTLLRSAQPKSST